MPLHGNGGRAEACPYMGTEGVLKHAPTNLWDTLPFFLFLLLPTFFTKFILYLSTGISITQGVPMPAYPP